MKTGPVLYRTSQKQGEEGESSMCWPNVYNLRRAQKSDCDALVDVLSGGKQGALLHFSQDENRGYKLPTRLRHGTCYIEINFVKAGAVGPEGEDDAKFDEIISTLKTIIRLCIERPGSGGVGGGYVSGKKKRLLILVEGRPLETTKNYLPTELPSTRPPPKKKGPQKFQPLTPPQPESHVDDTPHDVVLDLQGSPEEMEEIQVRKDWLKLEQKPHKPKSVLSP